MGATDQDSITDLACYTGTPKFLIIITSTTPKTWRTVSKNASISFDQIWLSEVSLGCNLQHGMDTHLWDGWLRGVFSCAF